MSQSVIALYSDQGSAAQAVDRMLAHGLQQDDISVLMSDATRGKEFAVDITTKAPEGIAAGAAAGGALGAIAAGLTAVGTLAATGGVGILAAGPIVAALAGAGAGAAAGGIVGGLIGLGFDEAQAKLVDQDIENGTILVAAEVNDITKPDVKNIFVQSGAKEVITH